MNQSEGWMNMLSGGSMTIWAVLAILVVVVVLFRKMFMKKNRKI